MATTKFDPYRTTGGTIELVRDPSTGAYSTKTVGFAKLPVLNLPELGTTTGAATTTATTTDTATDLTGTGVAEQTRQAFKEPQNDDRRGILDLDLTTKAKDISESLSDIDSGRGGDSASAIARQTANLDMGGTPMDVERRQQRQLGMTDDERRQQFQISGLGIQKATGDIATQGRSRFSGDADTTGVTVKDTSVIDRTPRFLKNLFGEPRGVDVARGKQPTEFTDAKTRAYMTTDEAQLGTGGTMQTQERSDLPAPQDRNLGISARPETLGDTGASMDQMSGTKLDTAKFAGSTAGTLADPAEKEDVKPASKKTFSDSVSTALRGFKSPLGALIESVVPDETQRLVNTANSTALKSAGYNLSTTGKIIGRDGKAVDAANSVFGGMNSRSAKGDISSGAQSRIDTRKSAKTQARIAKLSKERQKAFNDKTKQFEKELQQHNNKKNTEIEKSRKTKAQNPNLRGGASGGPGGCFIKGTLVTMANGSKKSIEKVNLGDYVAEGGKVFAVGRFLNTELYDYKGIKVSGSHMVNEDDTWMRVRDTKHGKSLGNDENTVYVFGSENRRILINGILFTDYFETTEQEKLINNEKNFFNNWKTYENKIDQDNINILNAS